LICRYYNRKTNVFASRRIQVARQLATGEREAPSAAVTTAWLVLMSDT